jgi:hypothetical protein
MATLNFTFQDNVNSKVPQQPQQQQLQGQNVGSSVVALVPVTDFSNTPSICIIGGQIVTSTTIQTLPNGQTISTQTQRNVGGVQLPQDVNIKLGFEKHIILDTILDGVPITEYVARKATTITITCTYRTYLTGTNVSILDGTQNTFPQSELEAFFQQIFTPNSVQSIENSYLNGLGINSIVIQKVEPICYNGSTNVQLTITAYENVAGGSLLLN